MCRVSGAQSLLSFFFLLFEIVLTCSRNFLSSRIYYWNYARYYYDDDDFVLAKSAKTSPLSSPSQVGGFRIEFCAPPKSRRGIE